MILDSDDDKIAISSDEELEIALLETQGSQVRKFYVTLYSDYEQQGTQASAEPGVRHVGVTCDSCDKGVYGFRYKCIQCPDYDLCMDCEAQSLHPEHCMLRIPVPMQWKSHYTRRLARHMNRLHKTQAYCSPSDAPKECPYKTRCEPRQRPCGDNTSWMDIFSTYVQDWANVANSRCPMKESQQSKEKSSEIPKERESKSSSRKNSESHVEFLKNIGEHIAQFLDPLGIDVNVQVKNDKAQNTSAETSTSYSANTSAAAASTSKVTEQNQSSEIQEKSVKFPDDTSKNTSDAAENLDTSSMNVMSEKSNVIPEGWTLLNETDSPPSTSNSSPVTSRAPSVAAEVSGSSIIKYLLL